MEIVSVIIAVLSAVFAWRSHKRVRAIETEFIHVWRRGEENDDRLTLFQMEQEQIKEDVKPLSELLKPGQLYYQTMLSKIKYKNQENDRSRKPTGGN